MLLEIIAFDIESCRVIERAGADRIELCDNPAEGGTTPSAGMIKQARSKTSIDLFPIIRPRGGDFLYQPHEIDIIFEDILVAKNLGCNGVVTGMLLENGEIDIANLNKAVELAWPMEVTFHRAFDRAANHQKALEDIINSGCTRILTSGGFPTAIEGKEQIKELIAQANHRITIMPGSGIRSNNVKELIAFTGAEEIHSSARKQIPSRMGYNRKEMGDAPTHTSTDYEEITQLIHQLANP